MFCLEMKSVIHPVPRSNPFSTQNMTERNNKREILICINDIDTTVPRVSVRHEHVYNLSESSSVDTAGYGHRGENIYRSVYLCDTKDNTSVIARAYFQ